MTLSSISAAASTSPTPRLLLLSLLPSLRRNMVCSQQIFEVYIANRILRFRTPLQVRPIVCSPDHAFDARLLELARAV